MMRDRPTPVGVTAEVGRLRRVIVHEPGLEIERMTPDSRREYLFDDTLYPRYARGEHRRFVRLLRALGIEVLEFRELLTEALAAPAARAAVPLLLDRILQDERVADAPTLYADLLAERANLPTRLVEGIEYAHTDLPRLLERDYYRLRPLPNLMYMRDLATVVQDQVLLGRLAPDVAVRRRETRLLAFVLRHHPAFATVPLFAPAAGAVSGDGAYFEGSALVLLDPATLLIGVNTRTTVAGVRLLTDHLAGWCLRAGRGLLVYLVLLTEGRHGRGGEFLDSVFTPLGRGEYLIYPPIFSPKGPEAADIIQITISATGEQTRTRLERLWDGLATNPALRLQGEPISCGGEDEVFQKREQWFGAVNLLVVAPGKVIVYSSAERTIRELGRRGYRVADTEAIIAGHARLDLNDGERVVLPIHGAELARGHGGPHSLVLPLWRDAVPPERGVA